MIWNGLFVVGAFAVCYGAYIIHPAAGWIIGGLIVCAVGIGGDWLKKGGKS
jgi:uncharacterized membrane protein AbrB (regulator of aidB expression)